MTYINISKLHFTTENEMNSFSDLFSHLAGEVNYSCPLLFNAGFHLQGESRRFHLVFLLTMKEWSIGQCTGNTKPPCVTAPLMTVFPETSTPHSNVDDDFFTSDWSVVWRGCLRSFASRVPKQSQCTFRGQEAPFTIIQVNIFYGKGFPWLSRLESGA